MNEFFPLNLLDLNQNSFKLPLKKGVNITDKVSNPMVLQISTNLAIFRLRGKISCWDLSNLTPIWEKPITNFTVPYKNHILVENNGIVEKYNSNGEMVNSWNYEPPLTSYILGDYMVDMYCEDYDSGIMIVEKLDINQNLKKVWSISLEEQASNRALLGEEKLVLKGDSGFYCLDWEMGNFVWELNMENAQSNIYEHLVWQNLVIIPMGLTTKAFDIHTGTLRWEQSVKGFLQGTIYEDKLYLIDSKYYAVLDVATGKIELEKDIRYIYNSFDSSAESVLQYVVAITETQAIFATSIGVLFVLDKWTGEVLWHYQGNGIINVKPLVYDQRVYFVEHNNEQTSLIILEEI